MAQIAVEYIVGNIPENARAFRDERAKMRFRSFNAKNGACVGKRRKGDMIFRKIFLSVSFAEELIGKGDCATGRQKATLKGRNGKFLGLVVVIKSKTADIAGEIVPPFGKRAVVLRNDERLRKLAGAPCEGCKSISFGGEGRAVIGILPEREGLG